LGDVQAHAQIIFYKQQPEQLLLNVAVCLNDANRTFVDDTHQRFQQCCGLKPAITFHAACCDIFLLPHFQVAEKSV